MNLPKIKQYDSTEFDSSLYWEGENGKVELICFNNETPIMDGTGIGSFTVNKKYVAEWELNIVKYKGKYKVYHIFTVIDDTNHYIPFSDNKNGSKYTRLYLNKYFKTNKQLRVDKLKKLKTLK
jgi:hypothetical protein